MWLFYFYHFLVKPPFPPTVNEGSLFSTSSATFVIHRLLHNFIHSFIHSFILGYAGSLLLHGLFSSCSTWGLVSSCGEQASPTAVASLVALGHMGCGSCSFRAVEHSLNSCGPGA